MRHIALTRSSACQRRTAKKPCRASRSMYSECPEDAAALLALVRNTQKLTVMLCAFVVAALRRTIDEPAQNRLVEMSVFEELQPDLSNSIDGMH